ncbi:hypothetical protein, partial [Micrococcus luteus]|uniref:hypothetical protein n=1 Tax=Micrococcus luteus TaxID=1270 RepID=UPI0033A89DEA
RVDNVWSGHRGDVLSRVLWKVRSKAPTVTASVSKMVVATGEGYTTIRDSTHAIHASRDILCII